MAATSNTVCTTGELKKFLRSFQNPPNWAEKPEGSVNEIGLLLA